MGLPQPRPKRRRIPCWLLLLVACVASIAFVIHQVVASNKAAEDLADLLCLLMPEVIAGDNVVQHLEKPDVPVLVFESYSLDGEPYPHSSWCGSICRKIYGQRDEVFVAVDVNLNQVYDPYDIIFSLQANRKSRECQNLDISDDIARFRAALEQAFGESRKDMFDFSDRVVSIQGCAIISIKESKNLPEFFLFIGDVAYRTHAMLPGYLRILSLDDRRGYSIARSGFADVTPTDLLDPIFVEGRGGYSCSFGHAPQSLRGEILSSPE